MQFPLIADVKHGDLGQPIKCAKVTRPTEVQRQNQEMLRYLVVVVALLAVLLLVAIALYYTQGNSITVKHVSSLRPPTSVYGLELGRPHSICSIGE